MTAGVFSPPTIGYEAVDGVIRFLSSIYSTPEQAAGLVVPHGQTSDLAAELYDKYGHYPEVVSALQVLPRQTQACHRAVFVQAIRSLAAVAVRDDEAS